MTFENYMNNNDLLIVWVAGITGNNKYLKGIIS
jgi:hypothetical protein